MFDYDVDRFVFGIEESDVQDQIQSISQKFTLFIEDGTPVQGDVGIETVELVHEGLVFESSLTFDGDFLL